MVYDIQQFVIKYVNDLSTALNERYSGIISEEYKSSLITSYKDTTKTAEEVKTELDNLAVALIRKYQLDMLSKPIVKEEPKTEEVAAPTVEEKPSFVYTPNDDIELEDKVEAEEKKEEVKEEVKEDNYTSLENSFVNIPLPERIEDIPEERDQVDDFYQGNLNYMGSHGSVNSQLPDQATIKEEYIPSIVTLADKPVNLTDSEKKELEQEREEIKELQAEEKKINPVKTLEKTNDNAPSSDNAGFSHVANILIAVDAVIAVLAIITIILVVINK